MRLVFADTAYWVALIYSRDFLAEAAAKAPTRFGPFRIMTSEMVLAELLNELSARSERLRRAAVRLVQGTMDNPQTEIIPQSTALFQRALTLYSDRPDKQWSLTDCASFVIMNQQKITEALTYDHHFEQAGFRALLRE